MRRFAIFAALVAASIHAQPAAVIEVNAAKALHPIPRTIYGSFLEPIGHSIYGGLWAQALENPSFEDNLWSADRIAQMVAQRPELGEASRMGLPLPWLPLEAAQGWRYEPRWGDAPNSFRSLLIMALPGKETGIRQEIYLPVHRTLRYTGSLYAKSVSGRRELEVSLRKRSRPADVLTKRTVALGENWAKHEFSLELPPGAVATREPVDFVIAASDEARVQIDQVFLFPADHIDGMNPEVVEMVRGLKSPVMRFGGNFTSGYHWRDGIGPVDKRISMLNQAWGMPEYNHFGTDEYLRFCQLVNARPQIALNLGSGTPAEAADWVRYVNERWGDHSGGLLWELGNELWGNFQIGYPTLERVAARTKEFSDAVRAVDPKARLIATGQDPDRFQAWNAAQLTLGPERLNYLSTHFVVGTADVLRRNPSREFIAQAALALPVGLERQLRAMKEQIDADPRNRGKVDIAFTEWLFTAPVSRAPNYENLGGGLCAGGFLNMLMRVSDFTSVADMTGNVEFGGVWQKRGRVYGTPAYWVFRTYSNRDATRLIETNTQVERYDVEEGVRRLPVIRGVPYLDVVAALNDSGSVLTIFCVNRDLVRDFRSTIRLSGFAAGSARGWQISAGSLYETNDEVRPEAVAPVEIRVPVPGSVIDHTFPRMSVTVIELRRAGQ